MKYFLMNKVVSDQYQNMRNLQINIYYVFQAKMKLNEQLDFSDVTFDSGDNALTNTHRHLL